jgi:hypothetical protein
VVYTLEPILQEFEKFILTLYFYRIRLIFCTYSSNGIYHQYIVLYGWYVRATHHNLNSTSHKEEKRHIWIDLKSLGLSLESCDYPKRSIQWLLRNDAAPQKLKNFILIAISLITRRVAHYSIHILYNVHTYLYPESRGFHCQLHRSKSIQQAADSPLPLQHTTRTE